MSYASDIEECTPDRCTGYCLTVSVRRCIAGQKAYDKQVDEEMKPKREADRQRKQRDTAVAV